VAETTVHISGAEAMSQREEIIARIASLPSLPSASTEVIRLLRDPEAPSMKIAQAIEYDPSLTMNVLRLANSTSLGFPQSVSTVKEAFIRLGPKKGFQSVFHATIGKIAEVPCNGYEVSGAELWEHLIGSAIASRRIAQLLNISPPEHTFTAALTHDIGKVVLGTFVEVNTETILALVLEEKITFEEAEQEVLGIDHAEVGACLLEHWNLPRSLVEAVRWHHQPENIARDAVTAYLVHVADVVCLMAGLGTAVDALSYRPSHHVMAELGLRMNALDEIVYEVLNELMRIRTLFKFEQGYPQ
jgi:putative nucleotidyltransferase with HDIG domain